MTKTIQLTKGKVAQISDHRYDELSQYKWLARFDGWNWYACRTLTGKGCEYMHRQIMNAPEDLQVDHIDGNGLNNTDENLRLCTRSQNQCNRKSQVNNRTGYRGVHFDCRRGKYIAQIKYLCKKIYIGRYDDAESAGRAYDRVAKEIHGEFACLNFPD